MGRRRSEWKDWLTRIEHPILAGIEQVEEKRELIHMNNWKREKSCPSCGKTAQTVSGAHPACCSMSTRVLSLLSRLMTGSRYLSDNLMMRIY